MFKLNKFAEGRFDVLAENGMRAGAIIGGADNWCAEVGSRVVGYFPTKPTAAKAVLKDRGIKGLYEQMKEQVEGMELLEGFSDDFYVYDKEYIEKWKCASSLIWVVRKHGTHLIPLDMPFTKRDGEAVLNAMHPDRTGCDWAIFLIDVDNLKVRSIKEATARSLVADEPKYNLINDFITLHGKTIASIKMSLAPGFPNFERRCMVAMECEEMPSERTLAILPRLAFHAVSTKERNLFAAPGAVEIMFGKKRLYAWKAEPLKP